jgi:hypothetical protein
LIVSVIWESRDAKVRISSVEVIGDDVFEALHGRIPADQDRKDEGKQLNLLAKPLVTIQAISRN